MTYVHIGEARDAVEALGENGVDLIIVSWKDEVTARLSSPEIRTVQTRREQYYAFQDSWSGLLAKAFIVEVEEHVCSSWDAGEDEEGD